MALYKEYAKTKALGTLTLSNWGGLEILDIKYGVDDYVVACFNWGTGRQQIRNHKIITAPSGRPYFSKNRYRYYLDEILWVD